MRLSFSCSFTSHFMPARLTPPLTYMRLRCKLSHLQPPQLPSTIRTSLTKMLTGLKLPNTTKSKGPVAIHIWTVPNRVGLVARCSNRLRKYRLEVLPYLHWCYVDRHRYSRLEISRGKVHPSPACWTVCCKRLTISPISQTRMMSLEDIGGLFKDSNEAFGETKNITVSANSSGEDFEKDNKQTQIEIVQH